MENKMEIFITNLDKRNITNEKTGEISNWCMVTYFIKKEDTDRSKGNAQLSCYCKANAFNDLEKYMYKWSNANITQTVEGNRIKLKIKSVDNVVVS